MTAGRAALHAALAACWVGLSLVLLRTAVPSGLEVPPVEVDEVFGRGLVEDAESYERFLLGLWLVGQVALLATLAVYARRGARFARESAAGPIGTGMLLGMLGLAIVWLVRLPFRTVGLWWNRRHDLTETGYLDWLLGDWLELGGTFLALCLALLVAMALARRLGEWWWIPATAALAGIGALFAFGSPYLATGLERPDPPLAARYERLAAAQGLPDVPLRVEEVSGSTSQANAYAFGLGPSRRVVLWDTLLDGRFEDGAVDVVMAHELAHHSSRHIAKTIGWIAIFALPGGWLAMRATRRRGGMGAPEAVPLALLVVSLYQLAITPATTWVSRRVEQEADWKALVATRDPGAARDLFVGFAETSLGDPSPPTLAYLFLSSHPTLAQRVAMADAWACRDAATSACTRARSRPRAG